MKIILVSILVGAFGSIFVSLFAATAVSLLFGRNAISALLKPLVSAIGSAAYFFLCLYLGFTRTITDVETFYILFFIPIVLFGIFFILKLVLRR